MEYVLRNIQNKSVKDFSVRIPEGFFKGIQERFYKKSCQVNFLHNIYKNLEKILKDTNIFLNLKQSMEVLLKNFSEKSLKAFMAKFFKKSMEGFMKEPLEKFLVRFSTNF